MSSQSSETRPLAPAPSAPPEKVEMLFRLCPLPIAVISHPEGRFLDVNGAFLRQIGLEDATQVIGATVARIAQTVDPANRQELVDKLRAGERLEGWRMWMNDPDGNPRAIELYADRISIDGEDCMLVAGLDVSQAFLDPLTGLPNRKLLEERLARALSRQREGGFRTAVLFIDLDGLKGVNDSLGHAAGDALLRGVAERLGEGLEEHDDLARIGGDELVAVLRVGQPEDAVAIARELRLHVGRPMTIGDAVLRPRASIGAAVADPDRETSGSDLLRYADVAMYRAKRTAVDGVALFTPGVDREAISESMLGRDLATALDRCELEVHYQPIVHLDDLSTWGVEALARWHHPSRGIVPPPTFISLAEMSGQIHGLGRKVLHAACRQVALWQFEEKVEPDFMVSVNVSAAQLQDEGFAREVEEVLRDTGLPAGNLQIEITERVALHQAVAAVQLAALGVRLALDDFGEGFCSLSYLRAMPIQTLKIDRSFVRDLAPLGKERELVWTIVDLADRLDGLEVIAEGIERPDQLRLLRGLGCRLGQGFLFGEAMPAEELAEVLADQLERLQASSVAASPIVSSTLANSSGAVNGLGRKGVSSPRMPFAASTPSR